ncbi:MAG: H+-transporting two-sector ATPase, subunit [Candidatus Angelobacter sp.]|nr:H+-transporting two-sector ATPase, subunit [Candidatus Angelobacter sp.]
MTGFRQRFWAHAILALFFLNVIAPAGILRAQESSKPASAATAERSAQEEHAPDKAEGQEKVKKGGEADAIRNAPAVKFIARHTGLTNDQAYWLCIGLNFAVIFFAIAGLMRKMLPGYFHGRTALIQKGIEEARRMSEDARRRLAEVEGRLSRLDTEIAGMKREAEDNAKAEEQRLLAATEEERRRIVTSAEQEIETAANAARRELKAYVADLAVQLAEKKIRVDKDTDEALVRAFTAQMGKDGN